MQNNEEYWDRRLEEATQLMKNGEIGTALSIYKELAAQGSTLAAWHLGHLYEEGVGTEKSMDLARSWYRLAADHPNAYWHKHYYARFEEKSGNGMLAFQLIEQNALSGYLPSIFRKGVYLCEGVGVIPQPEEGLRLIDDSIEAGHVFAMRHKSLLLFRQPPSASRYLHGAYLMFKAFATGLIIVLRDQWDPRVVN